MAKITDNCELKLYDYCKNCKSFAPWVNKRIVPDNDERGYLIERKEYDIVCRHGDVCEKWASNKS